ncbi:MAG: hypothetical protein GXY87_01640 [Tissierellia bacterium]|nr:hypothetical protein [Tissierellia bacterium]
MRFETDKTTIDLGYTPVENMFIHTYLSLANGDQIKVYLYALSNAHSNNKEEITNDMIAFEMGLSEGQVIDAWAYWQEKGLVEVKGNTVVLKSLRNNYINQLMGYDTSENQMEKEIIDSSFDNVDKLSAHEKKLIEDIEEFISQGKDVRINLQNNEIQAIHNLIRELNLTHDYFLYAYGMASVEADSKTVPLITKYIRNWYTDGAVDEASLDALLEKKNNEKKDKEEYISKKKSSKKPSLPKDDRMSREERKRFIENKMKNRDLMPRRKK